MSEHTPPISEEMLRALPSKVSHASQIVLLTVGIASTIISIAGEWSHGHHFLNQWLVANVSILGAILNLLLIALALFPGRIRPLSEDVKDEEVRRLATCINRYSLRSITWMWRSFGLLYVVLLFENAVGFHGRDAIDMSHEMGLSELWPAALIELFSTCSTLAIAVCYLSLAPDFLQEYVNSFDNPHKKMWHGRRLLMICLVSAAGGAAAALHLFLFRLPNSFDPNDVDRWATLANGVISAVALGYLVGRLDNKFISNWQWVIPPLFAYAGLQVHITAIEMPDKMMAALFTYSAFTMKCLLYIFLSNLFETRRILYYAAELMLLEGKPV